MNTEYTKKSMSSKESKTASSLLGSATSGLFDLELVSAKPGSFPHCDQPFKEKTPCSFEGSVDEFVAKWIEKGADKGALQRQTKNKVKKCRKCGKPCAFTLSNCNSCGADLTEVDISHTNNVFTGFIFGVKKGPFPFTISKRFESKDVLVFDDLLALTPAHTNCIPTSVYIPDVRYLFACPSKGLALVRSMFESSWKVMQAQFLSNKKWASKMVNTSHTDSSLRAHIAAGFNYPPSQYQLHLQFMLPIFTPFHFKLYQHGHHFTHKRFLPFEYVERALKYLVESKTILKKAHEMSIDAIFEHFDRCGIKYDEVWRLCYDRYGESHKGLATWDPSDFEYLAVSGGKAFLRSGDLAAVSDKSESDYKAMQKADKTTLQNYGRPYDEKSGRPTGSFYKYAKTPPLPELF
eukprot:g4579.t1